MLCAGYFHAFCLAINPNIRGAIIILFQSLIELLNMRTFSERPFYPSVPIIFRTERPRAGNPLPQSVLNLVHSRDKDACLSPDHPRTDTTLRARGPAVHPGTLGLARLDLNCVPVRYSFQDRKQNCNPFGWR